MCKHIHLVAKSVQNKPTTPTKEYDAGFLELSVQQGISRPKPKREEDISEAKNAFIADLVDMLNSGIKNSDQLTAVKNHCKSIIPMLNSIENRPSLQPTTAIDRTPANKNISKQRKFVVAKRKTTKKTPFQGTTQAEKNELAFQLLTGR